MEFGFTEEEKAFRLEVRQFFKENLPSNNGLIVINPSEDNYLDRVWELNKVMAQKLGEKGWLSLDWPEEFGGKPNSPLLSSIIQEELGYSGAPGWSGTFLVFAPLLIRFGTEQQKSRFLPAIRTGKMFWCEAYSEPEAGTDLASLKTLAIEDHDGFIINGEKLWVSGAKHVDWCHFLARTDPAAPKKHQGITYFLADLKTPGITVQPITDMDGDQALCRIVFDNVRIPADQVLGQKNHGWELAMTLLDMERGSLLRYVGLARRIFKMLVEYVKERGTGKNPLVSHHLADIAIELETMNMLAYRVAWLASQGIPSVGEIPIGKVFVLEAQQRCANAAMKILGIYGQLREDSKWAGLQGLIERWYLETYSFTIFAGTSEIQRNLLAMRFLGLPRGL